MAKAVFVLVAVLLACSAAGVRGHGSARMRAIVGEGGPGGKKNLATTPLDVVQQSGDDVPNADLTCKPGKTLRIADLDAAQNPKCVPCGSALQFACNGSGCAKGLKVLNNAAAVQPICVPDESYKPRRVSKTARGKRADKGGSATIGITKEDGCGLLGWTCCEGNTCDMGGTCVGTTCVPDRN